MKKTIITGFAISAMAVLMLFGCKGMNQEDQVTYSGEGGQPSVMSNKKDSTNVSKMMIVRRFEGTIPAADAAGIDYQLTLWNSPNYGDGTYELQMKYLGGTDGKDTTFMSSGEWTTLRGNPDDPDATLYQLNPGNVQDQVNFLYLTDSLVMLDKEQRRAKSKLNYTLKLLK